MCSHSRAAKRFEIDFKADQQIRMLSRLCVIGAGSWGTALAIALTPRFQQIILWSHNRERARQMAHARENTSYLPGFKLPENVEVSPELDTALGSADVVLFVVPSQFLRETSRLVSRYLPPEAKLVSATKGLEHGSLYRMSQVIQKELATDKGKAVAVLSGPTFAKEVAAGELAALVIASEDAVLAEQIQLAFATPWLRFYSSTDVTGVELGAALKNVVAIGAGICSGLGMGNNSIAALITRGLAEISRLAVKMGGHPRTISGLAGLGDLVLTATGDLSRNRFVGSQLGQGRKLSEILHGMTAVAEGVGTCHAAYQLGQREGVDLPIINKMHEVLYEEKGPREAIRELMERPLTNE
jgi:glycerol-3-phosphate dehydrogenase (NAD(P)+)